MWKRMIRASVGSLGYAVVRDRVPQEYARVRDELDQLRQQLTQSEVDRAGLRRDLTGYTAALDQTERELGECRTSLGQVKAELVGYKSALAIVERELGEHRTHQGQLKWQGPWPQVCFVHLGKTAGTSVFNALTSRFDPARIYHADADTFDRLTPGEVDRYDLVVGHCSYRHTRTFRPQRVMFTFVREPVDRTVSNYYFLRAWKGEINDQNRAMVASAQKYSLADFLRDDHPQVRFVYDNFQTYTLASDLRAERAGNDPAVLAAAVAHLDEFAVVGLTERVDDALELIARRLGWLPFAPVARQNVTQDRPRLADLSGPERDAVVERNHLDLQLYQEGNRRFEAMWDARAH